MSKNTPNVGTHTYSPDVSAQGTVYAIPGCTESGQQTRKIPEVNRMPWTTERPQNAGHYYVFTDKAHLNSGHAPEVVYVYHLLDDPDEPLCIPGGALDDCGPIKIMTVNWLWWWEPAVFPPRPSEWLNQVSK